MKSDNRSKETADAEMTTMRLSKQVKRSLKKLAQRENRSLSNYISNVLTNHVREAGEIQTQNG